jgi:glycosyltransferase involved in cell wall biosynthesis
MNPKGKRPFVVYWNNIPAPYMVERFNAIAERGNLYFEAWFNDRREPDRSWKVDESSWKFSYRYLPVLRLAGKNLHFSLPILKRKRPDVLVSLYAEPVFLVGWTIARLRGAKTIFRVVVTFDRWVKRSKWKEFLKRQLFKRVDGIETPGIDGRDFAMKYGASEEKIFYTKHAIDVEHYMKSRKKALLKREKIRDALGLRGITFVYVGRLWWGKGIRFLLDAFRDLQRRVSEEVSLLLVGDGEDEDSLKKKCRKEDIRNVVFAGFHQKSELPWLYAASDVFVFPTLGDPYGIVVNEAMASSLPVISTSAAGEIRDRIEDVVNGYIVPPEDSKALSDRMERLARDPELRTRMGRISSQKIAGHTPERWAEDFEKAVFKILNKRIVSL